jgi:hypothetical protein
MFQQCISNWIAKKSLFTKILIGSLLTLIMAYPIFFFFLSFEYVANRYNWYVFYITNLICCVMSIIAILFLVFPPLFLEISKPFHSKRKRFKRFFKRDFLNNIVLIFLIILYIVGLFDSLMLTFHDLKGGLQYYKGNCVVRSVLSRRRAHSDLVLIDFEKYERLKITDVTYRNLEGRELHNYLNEYGYYDCNKQVSVWYTSNLNHVIDIEY